MCVKRDGSAQPLMPDVCIFTTLGQGPVRVQKMESAARVLIAIYSHISED